MAVGQTLVAGRYLLREPVGSGGMGRVWLARDELLRRDVAIKEVVPPQWLTDEERTHLRELTLREAQAAARLNHPHVVKIYDVVQSELWPWIVMEYVPSRSLQSVLEQEGPLPPGRVATIGLAVLDALRAAHKVGVLHRDVKPHNVLIGDDGRVVLTDFGLATLDTDGGISRSGLIATPQYLAPERARRGVSSEAADMWSLGATMYAAVEGRTPYARPSVVETLTALATEPPDPPRQAGPLKGVIVGLLRREPAARLRPAEAERMLQRASAAGAGRRSPAPEPAQRSARRPSSQPHTWTWAGLTALAVLAVIAIAAFATNRSGGTDPGSAGSASTNSATVISRAAGVLDCEKRPAEATIVEPGRPGPPDQPNPLMTGYTWFGTPGGWYVAVHEGWQTWKTGEVTCFSDAHGRVLAIDPTRPFAEDPVAAGEAEEQRLTTAGVLPGYSRKALAATTISSPAAQWEFIYDVGGVRRHALALVVPDRAGTFVVYWATNEVASTASRPGFDIVRGTFHAGPPHGGHPPRGFGSPPPDFRSPPPEFRSPPPSPR